ncbi:MAG: transposase [Candidatus Dadabacteria bacterium]|nr:transposase [Candidatus Dadabacteria bacterium]
METLALLDTLLYRFQDLFGSQNFALFCAYVYGVILCQGRHTISNIYLAGQPQTRYWSSVKFLNRGKWDEEGVVQRLIGVIVPYLEAWVYVYDQTHTTKTGKKQFGLHFFKNHRYRLRNTNQSKFHWGHEFAGLGIVGITEAGCYLFPVFVKLLQAGAIAASGLLAFESIISIIPPGLIIFDRGFNNRKYFKALLEKGHHLLCRARKNMVFFRLPTKKEQPKRGRKKIYGRRISIPRLPFDDLYIEKLDKTLSVADLIVRTRVCPEKVHLVVVRTRPKKSKPYRYFLVYTTDLTLSVETLILHYKRRWSFEVGMHDSKESFGFDHYQVQSEKAIQRSVLLSFVCASLTQLLALPQFQNNHTQTLPGLEEGLDEMNIHWYHPKRWTLGLVTRYIRWKYARQIFSARFSDDKNLTKSENAYKIAAG